MSLIDVGETERTLLVVRECLVYKPGPRPDASGYRCQDWPKESWLFTGRLRVMALGDKCTIIIEDQNTGELFAQCPLNNDNPQISVEPVTDSSRYFVIRVEDGNGRHAFLGMGFRERSEAFDFNVALSDHVRQVKAPAAVAPTPAGGGGFDGGDFQAPAQPARDLSLKAGESIHINIGGRGGQRSRPAAGASTDGGLSALPPPPSLPGPPPSGGRRRAPPG